MGFYPYDQYQTTQCNSRMWDCLILPIAEDGDGVFDDDVGIIQ